MFKIHNDGEVSFWNVEKGGDCRLLYLRTRQILPRADILRSVPLPTISLFPETKNIANGSFLKPIDIVFVFIYI